MLKLAQYSSHLDRYIWAEIFPIFYFSSAILTAVSVSVGTLSDLSNKVVELNLPINLALQIFLYKIPEYLTYGLPTAVLLSTLIAFSRLSLHSEIVAMFSCGINIYRFLLPSIALSFLITSATLVVNELIVPVANYQANIIEHQFIDSVDDQASKSASQVIIYPQYQAKTIQSLFYAENFTNYTAENIIILYWSNQILDKIVTAHQGSWNAQQQVWHLLNSQTYQRKQNDKLQLQTNVIETYLSYSPLPIAIANLQRSPQEMNIAQALEYINLLELTDDIFTGGNPHHRQLKLLKIRTHQKIAFPFLCIVFALVGSALGCEYNCWSRMHCFGICLLIVFLYYTACFLTEALAVVELLPIIIAAWLPNFFGLLISGKLIFDLDH